MEVLVALHHEKTNTGFNGSNHGLLTAKSLGRLGYTYCVALLWYH